MEGIENILTTLIDGRAAGPCVSLYIDKGPARGATAPVSVDLYRELAYSRELLAQGMAREVASEYVRPLLQLAKNELVDEEPGQLALFRSGDVAAALRLPGRSLRQTVVADTFHVKPLLKALQSGGEEAARAAIEACADALRGGRAVTALYDVAQALRAGRVRNLWVAEDRTIWGMVNRKHGAIVLHPRQLNDRDGDVLDDLCEWALVDGARVIVLPIDRIPGREPVVAELKP